MIPERVLVQQIDYLINVGPTKLAELIHDTDDVQMVKLMNTLRDTCILLLRELISTNKEIEELRIRVYNHS